MKALTLITPMIMAGAAATAIATASFAGADPNKPYPGGSCTIHVTCGDSGYASTPGYGPFETADPNRPGWVPYTGSGSGS